MLRNYTNQAPPQSLSVRADASSSATSLTVGSTAGYPAPPFLLGLERGTANEEVCLCTAVPDGSHFTVVRHYDSTDLHAHEVGTSVEHTVAAIDFREANAHTNNADSNHRFPGEMTASGRSDVPSGWLLCDGSWVSKATYADLWTAVGDTWLDGAAAEAGGVGTFRLPDMRGAVAMGKATSGAGATLGSKGGSKDAVVVTHTHAMDTVGAHGHSVGTSGTHPHSITDPNHSHAPTGGSYSFLIGELPTSTLYINTGSNIDHANADVTWNGIHDSATGVTVTAGEGGHGHTTSNTDGGHAHTAAANVLWPAGTDRNLPPFKAVNWLIKT